MKHNKRKMKNLNYKYRFLRKGEVMDTTLKVQPKELALCLAKCESENEVIKYLKENDLWDSKHWRSYGDNENNFSIIGNQQSSPDAALEKKLINSIDAVLMRECMVNGIYPTSDMAPNSINKALYQFYKIPEGKIANLSAKERTELAEKISLIATGKKSKPNYTIIDQGEGQTPDMLPKTILSLAESNKMKIPFVQGKFNMGGSGVLQFCGEENLQLVISKRDPQVIQDSSLINSRWGVTIVRREPPTNKEKSSVYRYLAPNNEILSFNSETLPIHPTEDSSYGKDIKFGTFIKLFEYKIPGLTTNILFDLYNRLSILMTNAAIPIRLYERRDYKGKSLETTLSGLDVRLQEDKRNNIEEEFPLSSKLNIKSQNLPIQIYAFKDGKEEKYKKREGIIFTINGQNHGNISKDFFSRRNVGMGAISDSILIIVDCTKMNSRLREDLFMNSRDRLRDNNLRKNIEKELAELVKHHPALRELREKRRREKLENQLAADKPLIDVLENVIQGSPSLSKLFIAGQRLSNPFKTESSGEKDVYTGFEFPTFFSIKTKKDHFQKKIPINVKAQITFETDATNDYFNRDNLPGKERLELNGELVENYSLNLYNGIATLNLHLPDQSKINDVYHYTLTVTDESRYEPFKETFTLIADEYKDKSGGGNGTRSKGKNNRKDGKREDKSYLSLPNIKEVYREDWEKFHFDEKSALQIDNNGESGYDFFINADNIHLNTEIKAKKPELTPLIRRKYMYGMVLIGLSMILDTTESVDLDDNKIELERQAESFAKKVSPVLIPMIDNLGDLSEDKI